ncbi:ammonium transporter [Desulfofundulus thermobenzoicus]|uniref:Ammonium transporter n=1 Tax=Desulfofundulus thermobenzoicus TaxID=29376 RepID=A0A6N7ITQ3_9FIRM|nr:ammonium transporter [Desulfofundulus thermobenzoicus]MQL52899.1 ammonium transporter [Desulfofundulus thermobenzoicus]HHW45108.1 ammonium transporter [Desulfotomaculum sp.]
MFRRLRNGLCLLPVALLAIPGLAWADEPKIDTGDTAFVLISAALVMIMTLPGVALFYGGMVRRKNTLSTIMQSLFIMALVSVQWVLWGYTIAFGPDRMHLFGGLDWLGLNGVGQDPNPDYSATIPAQAFMAFQMMFAIITPALITGAFAERMRFPAFVAFILLWSTFVYDPLAHWVWGLDGWLRNLGALDFAGGTVVHISSGVSGLVAALVLGRRKGYGSEPMVPHNLPFTVLGAALLWFGWFGFNAGSALSANGLAASAFVVTNTAAAAAALSWVFAEWVHHGRPTVLGGASGLVAGLVAITPASGFVGPMPAVIIGLVAGVVCYLAVSVLKTSLGYDDSLDAFGVHGIGGTWGAIATGLFASRAINPAGADGLFFGNPGQLWTQIIAVAVSWVFAAVLTFVILKVVGVFFKLRASADEEEQGLDITQHGEEAYSDMVLGAPLGTGTVVPGAAGNAMVTKAGEAGV